MPKKEIINPDAAKPNPNLSPATRFGNLVFVSGQTGRHPVTGELGKDMREQTRNILDRIEPLGIHEVDEEIRHLCEDAERQTGTSAGPRTYAKSPAVFKALTAFRGALAREGTIDPVLRELVRIKIAGLNGCRY